MSGAIPPFPNTPSRRGAQLKKHRDNFTFTFLLTTLYKESLITDNRKQLILEKRTRNLHSEEYTPRRQGKKF
jgi:hypothetical protein